MMKKSSDVFVAKNSELSDRVPVGDFSPNPQPPFTISSRASIES